MKCFNHNAAEAVGVCKSCGKGLCHKCAAELPNGIACKDSCEKRVNLLNSMIDGSANVMSASNKQIKNMAYFAIVFGFLFIVLGVILFVKDEVTGILFVAMGSVFIVSGIIRSRKNSLYPNVSIKK